MNAAEKIIAKFGGQSALAIMLGKGQSTVQHWAKTGVIPAKWQKELLNLAQKHSINLSPSEFIETSTEIIVSKEPIIPTARWQGVLEIGDEELPCYVLDDGRRVLSRTGATNLLTNGKGGGNLEGIYNCSEFETLY